MNRHVMIRFHKFEIPELSFSEIEKQFIKEYPFLEMHVRDYHLEDNAIIEISSSVSTVSDRKGTRTEFEYTSKRLCDAYDAIKRRLGHYNKE